MRLYALNNIVKCGFNIYYIDIVGERLHLLNATGKDLYGVSLDEDERDLIEDIELSDWVLDALFQRIYYHDNEDEYYWDLGNTYYTIEKDGKGLYSLMRGSSYIVILDTVRELQNAYHFYSDYEDGEFLKEDIDKKLKKLFKLI